MPTEAILETHIDADVLKQAEEVYAAAGMTLERAVRNMLYKAAEDRTVPMDFFRPNAETVEAMEEARRGNLPSFDSVEALIADLNAPD